MTDSTGAPGDATTAVPGETERGAAERMTFFSDAVVAIAITLLAIDLPVPPGNSFPELAAGFSAHYSGYLAFLISFLVIARHWMSHHRVFRFVQRTTPAVVWTNTMWLLMIVITPFLTKFIAEDHVTFPRFTVYAVGETLQVGAFAVTVWLLGRSNGFSKDSPDRLRRWGWVPSVTTGAAFLVSIPFFPLIGSWAFAIWGVVPWIADSITNRMGITAGGHTA